MAEHRSWKQPPPALGVDSNAEFEAQSNKCGSSVDSALAQLGESEQAGAGLCAREWEALGAEY